MLLISLSGPDVVIILGSIAMITILIYAIVKLVNRRK